MVETQLCKLRGTSDIYTNYRSRVFYVLSLNKWRTTGITCQQSYVRILLFAHHLVCKVHFRIQMFPLTLQSVSLTVHSIQVCYM